MNIRRSISAAMAALFAAIGGMSAHAVEELRLPAVPAELVAPADRADYILMHFWDNMEFADTVRSHDRAFMEQNFVNYLSVFSHARPDAVVKSVAVLMDKASIDHDGLVLIAELADTYLFSADSPMRSEEYYVPFVEYVVASSVLSGDEKERARWLVAELRKCRPGTVAPDFEFRDASGQRRMLHDVDAGGRDIILLFYDPDCDTCHEVIGVMASDSDADCQVMAVCVGGDEAAWRDDLHNLPAGWIVGYPSEPVDEKYSIWSMPTIYRLTPGHVIKLKER